MILKTNNHINKIIIFGAIILLIVFSMLLKSWIPIITLLSFLLFAACVGIYIGTRKSDINLFVFPFDTNSDLLSKKRIRELEQEDEIIH